ncbi:MAG TPA: hypothetical protein VNA69_10325 [Thermoanaerobaculia bacterium]|nr:hypothetical protein [Thermoanaerobaculia bacterium]
MRRIILLLCLALALPLAAQETTAPAAPAAPPTIITPTDSAQTREELRELLSRLPPQVGKALKLDPSLWTNKEYLATYPALAAFVAQHPEIPHSPSYFLESVWIPSDPSPETPNSRMWDRMLETVSILGVIVIMVTGATWLIRTAIEHRRWSRVSKVQAEVHNKLLDRFASNEDLLAYVNTSAGKHFLESAPLALDAGPRAVAAPIGRVLWSVQAGIVLTAAGLGLKYIAWNAIDKDIIGPLGGIGVFAIAIGIGLMISALVALVLSKKLGVWQPPAALTDTDNPVTE